VNADVARVHRALADIGVQRFVAALGLKGRRNGQQWRVACPVHGGKDTNCVVGEKDGAIVFVCHSGCSGAGGDGLDLVAAVRGYDIRSDFGTVLAEAAAIAGIALDGVDRFGPIEAKPKPIDPAVERHQRELAEGRERILGALLEFCPLDGEGLRYLTHDRGLDAQTCKRARVGYVADAERVKRVLLNGFPADVLDELGIVYRGEHLAFASHPLLFPVIEKGRPVYLQGRALGAVAKKQDRWRSMRGGVPALWGVDSLDRDGTILLCEGPVDGLSAECWLRGRRSVVAILGAGGLKPEWCLRMRGRTVTIALDPDEAGDRGAAKATRMLHEVGATVKRLELPQGLDLNAWFCAERAA
jgi:DNA primase